MSAATAGSRPTITVLHQAMFLALVLVAAPMRVDAWGLKGHTIVGEVAVAKLPAELPAFMRSQAAKDEIVYLQAEEDRLKIGEDEEAAWASEWPTDHYLDIGDDGKIAGVVAIDALPATRDAFEQALAKAPGGPVDAYRVGFLPYSILEGYEQVRSDFALWRLARNVTERRYREELVIHDIGIFSHFVGDGCQPLHVNVHYNGWGDYPNPRGFSNDRNTHAQFESDFVDRYLSAAVVLPYFHAPVALAAIPLREIGRYLKATDAQVVPLYELKARGGFDLADSTSGVHRDAVSFTASRLAAGAQMLDALILTAWRTSSTLRESA